MLNKEVKARIERNKVRRETPAWKHVRFSIARVTRLGVQTQALLSGKHIHDEEQRHAHIESIRAANDAIFNEAHRILAMSRLEFHAYLREQRS